MPLRARPAVALALLLAAPALLAGCMGAGAPPNPAEGGGPGGPVPAEGLAATQAGTPPLAAPPADAVPLRFRHAGPWQAERVVEGAFALHEHWWPTGFALANVAGVRHSFRVEDITDLIPPGVPARVELLLEASMAEGDLDVWLDAPFDAVWSVDGEAPRGGTSRLVFTLVLPAGEEAQAVVMYDEPEPALEVPYTLTIRVASLPEVVPHGLAVALDLPGEGAELLVERVTEASEEGAQLVLWDPQDRLVGRYDVGPGVTVVRLPADAPAGAYVALLPAGLGDLRFLRRGGDGAGDGGLAAVEQVLEWGPTQMAASGQEVTWTFDLPRAPLQLAFILERSAVVGMHAGRIEGPEGVVVSFDAGDDVWLMSNGWWFGPMGGAGLVPGTYTGTFQAGAAVDVAVTHLAVHYAR